MRRLAFLIGLTAVGLAAAPMMADASKGLELVVSGAGAVSLAPPSDWACEVGGPPDGPTLACARDAPGDFSVMVTAIVKRAGALATDGELKEVVERTGNDSLPTAVQPTLELRRVQGPVVAGYVYSLTDRSPERGPDDYREMTQGLVVAGPFALSVTVLSHTGDTATVAAALAMLSAATVRAEAVVTAPGTEAAAPDHLVVRETEAGYELSVPVSRLVMTLPKGRLVRQQADGDGATGSPRYFLFHEPAANLYVSGWFEPAESFAGVETFWSQETAASKGEGIPEPVNVSFEKIGTWQAILYDIEVPGMDVRNTHIRAHWIQSETWIDVHVSVTTSQELVAARRIVRDVLEGIQVRESAP